MIARLEDVMDQMVRKIIGYDDARYISVHNIRTYTLSGTEISIRQKYHLFVIVRSVPGSTGMSVMSARELIRCHDRVVEALKSLKLAAQGSKIRKAEYEKSEAERRLEEQQALQKLYEKYYS